VGSHNPERAKTPVKRCKEKGLYSVRGSVEKGEGCNLLKKKKIPYLNHRREEQNKSIDFGE